MKLFPSLGAAALLLFAPLPTARAQVSPSLVPERQWHLDLAVAGLSVGFAARTSERTSFGVEIGAGGNWLSHLVSDGGHFTEGGPRSSSLLELAHATVFVRTHFSETRHLDVGLKGSGFLHSDSSDDDPGGGYFVGLNAKYSWARWRRLSFASEMDVGRYAEPGSGPCISGCEGVRELGVNVAPILVRLSVP